MLKNTLDTNIREENTPMSTSSNEKNKKQGPENTPKTPSATNKAEGIAPADQTKATPADTKKATPADQTKATLATSPKKASVPGIASLSAQTPPPQGQASGIKGQTVSQAEPVKKSTDQANKISEVQASPNKDTPTKAQEGQEAGPVPVPQGRPNIPPTQAAPPTATDLESAERQSQEQSQKLLDTSPLPNPSDVDFAPPLIQSMVDLCRLHGKAISSRQLAAYLPKVKGEIHPSACIRAAREAGMEMTTVYRPSISKITPFTLPCILLLHEGQSCVLTGLDEEHAICIFPEGASQKQKVRLEDLEKSYLGYAIFGKPESKLDERASRIQLVEKKQWFWGTLAHYLPIYKHVIGASLVVNLLAICGPLFFMTVYDRVVPNNATDTLWMLASGICVAYIFDFLLRNLRSYFVDTAGRNADVIIASRLMQHLLSMRLDVKPDSAGSLANNLREFESLREFFGSTTLMALVDLPFLFFFIALIFFIGGPIGFIPTIAVPIVVGAGIFLQRPMQEVTEKGFKENMQKNALLYEIIGGLEAIKATMAEGRIQHAWENVVGLSAASNAHSKRMSNFSMTLTVIVTQLVSIGVIIWGVYRIGDRELSMGGLIACNMLAGRAMAPLSQIASMLTRLQQSRMALLSLDQIMKLDTEEPAGGEYIEFGHLESELTLEDISFKYPGSERLALDRISIRIRPGEKVGVIGRMGSGKTTFGRLCVGFYQPTEGAVKFGGGWISARWIPSPYAHE